MFHSQTIKRLFEIKFSLVILFVIFAGTISIAYGHGLGSVESEVLRIDGTYYKVLVETNPDVLDQNTNDIEFKITTIEIDAEQTVSDITYNIEILEGQTQDQILSFDAYSPDDQFISKITPSENIEFSGSQTENGAWIGKQNDILQIFAPLFFQGGLVQVNVTILSIGSESISTSDNTFETLLTIGEYIPFHINYKGKEHELLFATYFDRIDEFKFDEKDGLLTADMPFNWNKEFVERIPFVHAEYYVPTEVDLYKNHEIIMTINGIKLLGTIDRSGEEEIVVHFLIPTKKLEKYSDQMPPEHFNQIIFGIEPGKAREEEKADAALEEGEKAIKLSSEEDWKLHLWLEPKGQVNPNKEISLNIEFHDPVTNAIIKDNTYDLDVFLNGELLLSKSELHTPDGRDRQTIVFDETGAVILRISNINDFDTTGEFAFLVKEPTFVDVDAAVEVTIAEGTSVPGCEETNSCYVPYQANVKIGDYVTWINADSVAHTVTSGIPSEGPSGKFDSGIIDMNAKFSYQFEEQGEFDYFCSLHPWMIGLVNVQTVSEVSIPDWIKNNAAWWSSDQIDDDSFVSGIQYLIKEEIMIIPETQSGNGESQEIPEWIKNNAGWWADGLISDSDFVSGIQWLITNGVMKV